MTSDWYQSQCFSALTDIQSRQAFGAIDNPSRKRHSTMAALTSHKRAGVINTRINLMRNKLANNKIIIITIIFSAKPAFIINPRVKLNKIKFKYLNYKLYFHSFRTNKLSFSIQFNSFYFVGPACSLLPAEGTAAKTNRWSLSILFHCIQPFDRFKRAKAKLQSN